MRLRIACVVGLGTLLVCVPAAVNGAAPSADGSVSHSRDDLQSLVAEVSREHGVDPKLVDALVRVESAYDPRAVSKVGAMGLMQLMPETATRLDVDDPFDPEQNVRGGVREFSRLLDRYSGNLQFALAAYNAGEGAVARYRGIPPYAETRSYVSKILTIYTGRPYRLGGSYRGAVPVRMTTDQNGQTVISNVAADGSAGLSDGPLRGGFGSN